MHFPASDWKVKVNGKGMMAACGLQSSLNRLSKDGFLLGGTWPERLSKNRKENFQGLLSIDVMSV